MMMFLCAHQRVGFVMGDASIVLIRCAVRQRGKGHVWNIYREEGAR